MKQSLREKGIKGEELALEILKKDGYKIIERNYHSPYGEIDIIAKCGDVIVFVEVKRRDSKSFGDSLSAIDEKKKRRIVMTALYYLKKENQTAKKFRFDVVGIDENSVKVIKNAFVIDWE
ncbi:MAG: YraN family protein [Deltaproteobacteria bacterium]|nr:YraN family protein [Deltaproteobacteria bacterium]